MSEQTTAAAGAVLGETTTTWDFDDRATLAAVSLAMLGQCRRQLDLVGRHLDPGLYDSEPFVAAVKTLVLGSARARVRLLVVDPRPLVTQGHRLLDLAARLSSFIEVRVPAPRHRTFNEAFLLADGTGYVHRQFSDRHEGRASFHDRRVVGALADRFGELWEHGSPDLNFRRLHL